VAVRAAFGARDVEARADEPLLVDGHGAVVQPVRVRIGADERNAAHGAVALFARLVIAPAGARQAILVAFEGDDFRVRVQGDAAAAMRSIRLDMLAPSPRRGSPCGPGRVAESGRLAGRAAAAHEDDLPPACSASMGEAQ
jgi:hypothetical protein